MENLLKYVDVKQDVYRKKFERIERGQISWNWCAFLVSGLWLLYRRMYSYFFILMGVSLAASCIGALLPSNVQSVVSLVIGIFLCVLMGLFGDKLYYNRIKSLYEDDKETGREPWVTISKKGGVSKKAVIIYLAVVIGLVIFSFVYLATIIGLSGIHI